MIGLEAISMALGVRLPAVSPAFAGEDDRALMMRYAESRDESAFARVLARHARMVYGVCRRAVGDSHLAEDAFQAVFLVLANHPRRAANSYSVGGWLFGVARRVGLAARRREHRHARRVAVATSPRESQPDFDDLLRVLDEELAALPEEFRAPLVTCFLQERTLDEAARHLGWSVSTLRRRLDRAKDILRARLTRRGATLAGGLFAGFLAQSASAALPPRLLELEPSPLARALATEFGKVPMSLKAALVSFVVAVGLGGIAMGIGRDNSAPGAEARPPAPAESHARAVAPEPRAVDAKWTTIRGRIVFPENRALPGARIVPAATIKDFDFFGQQIYRDVLIDRLDPPGSRRGEAARSRDRGVSGGIHAANHGRPRRRPARPSQPDAGAVHRELSALFRRARQRVQRSYAAGADAHDTTVARSRAGRFAHRQHPPLGRGTSLGVRTSLLRGHRRRRRFHDRKRAGGDLASAGLAREGWFLRWWTARHSD
jgi:RNA polymerase sigma factor (sigma-70 family)